MGIHKISAYFGHFLLAALLVLFSLAILETAARSLGYAPWQPEVKNTQVQPDVYFFQKDEVTGFKCRPGYFKITLEDSLTFTCTNNSRGHRLTHNPDHFVLEEPQKTIWLFGGSYTYGWSVSDTETYPWLLQQAYPTYQIVNFGVPGFGTLQSYLQYKQALDDNCAPDMVILAYAGFHDMRNVGARMWHKTLAPYNQLGPMELPVANLPYDAPMSISYQPLAYQPFPLQDKLALGHAFEQFYNKEELLRLRANDVSIALIDSFQRLTEACMSRFVLATIVTDERSKLITDHCHTLCIKYQDISVDTRPLGMTNEPFDSHPSAKAHQLYARHLADLLADWQ